MWETSIVWVVVVVADDDLSYIDKHISDCCLGNMKTFMFPEATFRHDLGLCIFCIDVSNFWLGCRGVENEAPFWSRAMPSMASSFGGCLPLRVVQAKHRLKCQLGRHPLKCHCLAPQKPDLTLLFNSTPVHIFAVQHMERQVRLRSRDILPWKQITAQTACMPKPTDLCIHSALNSEASIHAGARF